MNYFTDRIDTAVAGLQAPHPFIVWLCAVRGRKPEYERIYKAAAVSPGAFYAKTDKALVDALLRDTTHDRDQGRMMLADIFEDYSRWVGGQEAKMGRVKF